MSDLVGTVVMGVVSIGALAMAIVTRLGRSERARRVLLGPFRRSELPALLRNAWISMPVLAPGVIAIWLGLYVVPAWGGLETLPDSVRFPIAFAAFAALFIWFGGYLLLASRPPKWLVPSWLVESDQAIGFVPARLDWFDRGVIVIGVMLVVAGSAICLALILGIVHR